MFETDHPCGFGWMSQNGDLLGKNCTASTSSSQKKNNFWLLNLRNRLSFKKKYSPRVFKACRFFVSRLFEWLCVDFATGSLNVENLLDKFILTHIPSHFLEETRDLHLCKTEVPGY